MIHTRHQTRHVAQYEIEQPLLSPNDLLKTPSSTSTWGCSTELLLDETKSKTSPTMELGQLLLLPTHAPPRLHLWSAVWAPHLATHFARSTILGRYTRNSVGLWPEHLGTQHQPGCLHLGSAAGRFVSRRGSPSLIRSDNATTFRAAADQLLVNWRFNPRQRRGMVDSTSGWSGQSRPL